MTTGIYPEIYDYENPAEAKRLIREIKALYAEHDLARQRRDKNECHAINGRVRDLIRRLPRRTVNFNKGRAALIAWVRQLYIAPYARYKRNTAAIIKTSLAKDDYRGVMSAGEGMGRSKVRKNLAEQLIVVMSQPHGGFRDLELAVLTFLEKHVDFILDGEAHAYDEGMTEPITDANFVGFARREIIGRIRAWANGGDDADPGISHKFMPSKLHDATGGDN